MSEHGAKIINEAEMLATNSAHDLFVRAIANTKQFDKLQLAIHNSKASSFVQKTVEELTLIWWSQGGTEYSTIQPYMVDKYIELLGKCQAKLEEIWTLTFR